MEQNNTNQKPKTIAELQQWYADRNLPPYETTRFFIGINYTQPKAFGIYEEDGRFIVYKNKADGSRAVRYNGPDEAYAVNEIYLKLKDEILNQKSRSAGFKEKKKSSGSFMLTIFFGFVGLSVLMMLGSSWLVRIALAVGVTLLSFYYINKRENGANSKLWTLFRGACVTLAAWLFFYNVDDYPIITIAAAAIPILVTLLTPLKSRLKSVWMLVVCLCLLVLTLVNYETGKPKYYRYNDTVYCAVGDDCYYYDGDYYYYDPYPPTIADMILYSDYDDYYAWDDSYYYHDDGEYYYENGDNYSNWFDDYIDEYSNRVYDSVRDSDYDSDYDWDSSFDWDSGSSDWSSDW